MRAGIVCIAVLALSGCGDKTNAQDGAMTIDLAMEDRSVPSDMAMAPDLSMIPDLAITPDLRVVDLSTPVDLAKTISDGAPPDLVATDMAMMPSKCPANAGYGSTQKPDGGFSVCGQQGTCNGHVYALDCNGFTCVCSVDKQMTASVVEMFDSCQNLNTVWQNACQF